MNANGAQECVKFIVSDDNMLMFFAAPPPNGELKCTFLLQIYLFKHEEMCYLVRILYLWGGWGGEPKT